MLYIANSASWPLKQIDIHNAFLHGFLSEEVYMIQPPGFHHPTLSHLVCKLNKALYGLNRRLAHGSLALVGSYLSLDSLVQRLTLPYSSTNHTQSLYFCLFTWMTSLLLHLYLMSLLNCCNYLALILQSRILEISISFLVLKCYLLCQIPT